MKISKISKIVIAIVAIIIIVGIVICSTIGFNFEEKYSSRKQIRIDNSTEINIEKIQEIAQEVLTNREVTVNKVEFFGNSAVISAENITEEEKENIINKVNEEYSSDIKNENVKIISIAHTRITDILKKYIKPSVITLVIVALYSIIRYRKLGVIKVLIKTILIPVFAGITYYSLIAITRLPFGDITTAIALEVYILTIFVLTLKFEKELGKILAMEESK